MNKITVKSIVVWAVYLAIFAILGFTPLGYPSIGVVNFTLVPLLIIIITMHIGLRGLVFGFLFFGLTSFIKQWIMIDPLGSAIVSNYSLGSWFVVSFVSRMALGICVFIGYFFLKKRSFTTRLSFIVFSTIIGNTFFFLSVVSFYGYEDRSLWVWFTLIIPNLIIEWIILPIISFALSPLIIYLRKVTEHKNSY